jgi:hypothetical protein
MASFMGDSIGNDAINYFGGFQSDTLVEGSPNELPSLSETPQSSTSSIFTNIKDLLGSLGTTARDIGRTVGQVETTIRGADDAYRAGRTQGQTEAEAKNWWDRRTEFEKFGVVIAVAALGVGLYTAVKGN